MNEAEIISLLSHTIGSIGQVMKDIKNNEKAVEEIQRIYNGYVARVDLQ